VRYVFLVRGLANICMQAYQDLVACWQGYSTSVVTHSATLDQFEQSDTEKEPETREIIC
jgi:hypothetical protein